MTRNDADQQQRALTILGIESSCDDTCAAVVRRGPEGPQILSNIIWGQGEVHGPFGGVVPELAARAHAEKVDLAVEAALQTAEVTLPDIDAIAVTAGPGLVGGLLAGIMCAKGLAAGSDKPIFAVNHLAGHALTPRLTDGLAFPYLLLLVSGGHCQFLEVSGPDEFRRIGGTIDDAPGEAFDKIAKLLGLGYPGGPLVEVEAQKGDPTRFKLPRPLLDRDGCDMSFSGLKTATVRARDEVLENGTLRVSDRQDLCAAFQQAVCDVLAEKSRRALAMTGATRFAVAGGVAANKAIGTALAEVAARAKAGFCTPPLRLCTDNAAMIAWAGIETYAAGRGDGLAFSAHPRWPLDTKAAPMLGAGKRGAKA